MADNRIFWMHTDYQVALRETEDRLSSELYTIFSPYLIIQPATGTKSSPLI